MISQPTYSVSRLSLTTSRYMAKANRLIKAKKREYIGSIEGTRVSVTMFISDFCAMRRQTCLIMIASRLTKVVVANGVDEDHQDRPGDEEEHHRRQVINGHTHFQPGVPDWQPVEGLANRMLSQIPVFELQSKKQTWKAARKAQHQSLRSCG